MFARSMNGLGCYADASTRRRFVSCRRGAIAVEFALVLPVLLFVVLNLFAGAIYLGASNSLTQLAAEAARASIAGVSDSERGDLARRSVTAAVQGGSLIAPSAVAVAVGADPVDPQLYRVTLTFDARSLGLSTIPGIALVAPATLTSSYGIRRGGL